MELNLNYVFKALDGTEIRGLPKEDEEGRVIEGEIFTLKVACANALLGVFQGEENLSGAEKAKRYHLAMRIHASDGKVDLSVDELKLLKDLMGKNPSSLIVGQAFDILDPPKQEIKGKIPSRKNK